MSTTPASGTGALDLRPRPGPRPQTSVGIPHRQLDQQPNDNTVRNVLACRLFALPGVEQVPSGISVPGAQALSVENGWPLGPPSAFLIGREFAHLHPDPDLSLHLTLPTEEAEQAVGSGWAELHPLVARGQLPPTVVMLFAPRDQDEADVVENLVRRSWRFATEPGSALPPADRKTINDWSSRC